MEMRNISPSISIKGWNGMLNHTLITSLVIVMLSISLVIAKDLILTVRQDGKDFEDALKGLTDELKNEFDVKDKVINKKTTVEELSDELQKTSPKLIVLMDNTSISLYKKYQGGLNTDQVVPSVALMGVFIKDAIKDVKNVQGISYEIPVVTSVVSLRAVLGTQMKKVGIVHRDFLNDFLLQNKEFCKREGLEIVNISLPNKSTEYKSLLKKGLKTLLEEKSVDVLWVPNDNAFLQQDILQNVWIPTAKKYKKPVVVGVEVLVNPQLDFGTFAVLPDHVSLGSQAAEMIYEIMDNDWQCEDQKVDPPLAVYKIINLNQAKKTYKVSDDNLKTVDKKIK